MKNITMTVVIFTCHTGSLSPTGWLGGGDIIATCLRSGLDNRLRGGGEGVVTVLLGGLGGGEVLQDLVGRGTGFIDCFLDLPLAWFRCVDLFLVPIIKLFLIVVNGM